MSTPASAMSAVELMPAPMATPVACRCSTVSGRQPESSNACTGRRIGRREAGAAERWCVCLWLPACQTHSPHGQPAKIS